MKKILILICFFVFIMFFANNASTKSICEKYPSIITTIDISNKATKGSKNSFFCSTSYVKTSLVGSPFYFFLKEKKENKELTDAEIRCLKERIDSNFGGWIKDCREEDIGKSTQDKIDKYGKEFINKNIDHCKSKLLEKFLLSEVKYYNDCDYNNKCCITTNNKEDICSHNKSIIPNSLILDRIQNSLIIPEYRNQEFSCKISKKHLSHALLEPFYYSEHNTPTKIEILPKIIDANNQEVSSSIMITDWGNTQKNIKLFIVDNFGINFRNNTTLELNKPIKTDILRYGNHCRNGVITTDGNIIKHPYSSIYLKANNTCLYPFEATNGQYTTSLFVLIDRKESGECYSFNEVPNLIIKNKLFSKCIKDRNKKIKHDSIKDALKCFGWDSFTLNFLQNKYKSFANKVTENIYKCKIEKEEN
jgi:hypothetical protein